MDLTQYSDSALEDWQPGSISGSVDRYLTNTSYLLPALTHHQHQPEHLMIGSLWGHSLWGLCDGFIPLVRTDRCAHRSHRRHTCSPTLFSWCHTSYVSDSYVFRHVFRTHNSTKPYFCNFLLVFIAILDRLISLHVARNCVLFVMPCIMLCVQQPTPAYHAPGCLHACKTWRIHPCLATVAGDMKP